NFDQEPIIQNNMVGYNCINCHSFAGGDPEQMMFHMRASNGGTYIVQDGQIERLNTQTDHTISNLTYPYWHPSGRYITTSVNTIHQFFHATDKKIEVWDLRSDVVVYDVEQHKILSKASIQSEDNFETFPSFSPDGHYLYFCSAPATEMPDNYDKVRYNLCRVEFDAEKGEIRGPIDTLVRADSLSYTFPRLSPDGRYMMYTETAYGQFPIWHSDAEIRMIDVESRQSIDMSALNSPDTESYHSWSSGSDWVVVSSRRDNSLYTLPYICHIGEDGRPAKPFLLPQEDPDTYDRLLYSFNIPELVRGRVEVSPYDIVKAAKQEPVQVKYE
ncbi:MAG: PD40 domain-containing protein, partial [Alistipes sp.]|nr:PD40 domain-containing protein [Alistipes sp.]